jgi:hypothetical protein
MSGFTLINVGAAANDGNGDSLRVSQQAVNTNFGTAARGLPLVTGLASEAAASGYTRIVQDLGRGGIFKAVNSGTADDVDIFSSATVGWTWQRMNKGFKDIREFGVSTSSSDNQSAFQTAIDWAEGASNTSTGEWNSNGKKGVLLFIPPGVYKTSPIALKDGVILFGTSGSMIRAVDGMDDNLVTFSDINGWSIIDIIFDGNKANQSSGSCFDFNYTDANERLVSGLFQNVKIQNFKENGINFVDGLSINDVNSINLHIKSCDGIGIDWRILNDSKWVNTDISFCTTQGLNYDAKNNQILNTKVWGCRLDLTTGLAVDNAIPIAATEAADIPAVQLSGERSDFVGLQIQENGSIGLRIGSATDGFNLSSITNLLVDGNGGYDADASPSVQADYRRDGMQLVNYYKTKISGVCDDFRAQRGYGRQKRGVKSIGTIPTFTSGSLKHSDFYIITDNSGGLDVTNAQIGYASPSNAVGTIFQARSSTGANITPTSWGTGTLKSVNDYADIELVIANQYEQDQGTGTGYDILNDGGHSFIRVNGSMISTPNRIKADQTLNFGTIAAGDVATITPTVTGAEVGDNVVINPRSTLLDNFRIDSCRVSATDTLEIKLKNGSSGSQTINQAFDIVIFKE